jgi:hypothetical protein
MPDHFESIQTFRRPDAATFAPAAAPVAAAGGGARPASIEDEFRSRLRIVTHREVDPSLVPGMVDGPTATRESRMSVVARIAILDFNCRISGGFLRDWIVRGERQHPATPPGGANRFNNDWLMTVAPGVGFIKYDMQEGVIPKDLDAELPHDEYFDVARFIGEVRKAGITVDHYEHVAQRHVFVFEADRGPFTMDCIEHHFAALHAMADFDANLLTVMSPCEDLVGLKAAHGGLDVDTIIGRILKKELLQLKSDDPTMIKRVQKMEARGWTVVDRAVHQPVVARSTRSTMVRVYRDDDEVKEHYRAVHDMGGRDIQIYRIENRIATLIFDAEHERVKEENGGDANEKLLYHGTKGDAALSILHSGFDDRYWTGGQGAAFGRAAYFAPIPAMSHDFTDGPRRYIFVCRVLLGKQALIQPGQPHYHVPPGVHSAVGREPHWFSHQDQFMIYRYGQAIPLYMIQYSK